MSADTPSQYTITLRSGGAGAAPPVEIDIPRELGPVRLLHEIGRGGMGVVYLGRHDLLNRDVAVKFLLEAIGGTDDPGFTGFLEGARAAAAVDHPALTTIHHADLIDKIPFLVMQYIEGPTLRDLIKAHGALSPEVALAVVQTMAGALAALHERDIVHRDIKPANVLLDGEAHLYVTDFGLACGRRSQGQEAAVQGLAGTPAYMAPEMFAGGVSPRSDVYALGITMFEMLSGSVPFTGSVAEVRAQHRSGPLPVERIRSLGLTGDLVELLERTAHKDAMFRYKTAGHLVRALQELPDGAAMISRGQGELGRIVARFGKPETSEAQGADASSTPTSYFETLATLAAGKRLSQGAESGSDAGRPGGSADTVSSAGMVAAADDATHKAPVAGTLTEVASDGWFARDERAVLRIVLICLAFLVALGLVITSAVLILGALFKSGQSLLWLLPIGLAVGLALRMAWSPVLWKTADGLRTLINAGKDDPMADLANTLVDDLSGRVARMAGLKQMVSLLAQESRLGETLRVCAAKQATPIEPFADLFEPIPLDEACPPFTALDQAVKADAAGEVGADNRPSGPASESPAPRNDEFVRRVKRNVSMKGGWVVFGTVAVFVVMSAVQAIRQSNLGLGALLVGLVFISLLVDRPGWNLLSSRQWFVVPGGLVLRSTRIFQRRWRVQLFDRRRCVLGVYRRDTRRWVFTVADQGRCESAPASPKEAEFLLRAWLSPQTPPPVDGLGDLE